MDVSTTKLSGRRIVDVNYLIRQLILASNHGNQKCGLKEMDFIQENRVGLKSTLHYKCRSCFLDFDLRTEFDRADEMDINALVTLGICKSGAELSSVETIFTSADIPFISPSEFCDTESKLVNGLESGDNPGYCVYCGNAYTKLISHMALHHKKKNEVKRLLSLQKKNDPLHSVLFRALCQKGESFYRDRKSSKICPSCDLSFSIHRFPVHAVSCPLSKSDGVVTISDMINILSKDKPHKLASFQEGVVSKLTHKDVRDHVPMDPVLVGYGIDAMERENGEHADFQQLRNTLDMVVSSFLLMAKKSVDIKTIVDIFDISQWDTFIEAIHEYARENSADESTPLMIDELGRQYFHVASFVVSKCKEFLLESDYCESWMGFFRGFYVKPKQLTWAILTNRLVHSCKRLSNEIYCLIEALTDDSSNPQVFEALNEATIMKIAACNRRMFVQVDDMLISEFNQRMQISSTNADIWSVMSESEKYLANDYEYVNVCSQFGRFDVVLLDKGDVRAIETILSCRKKFGVSQKNVFVFGRGSSQSYQQSLATERFIQRNHHIKPLFTSLCYEMKLFVSSTAQVVAMDRPIHVLKKLLGFVGCSPNSAGEALTEVLDWAKLSRLICALNLGRFGEFSGLKFCEVPINTDIMAPVNNCEEVVAPTNTELRLATTVPKESATNVRFECPMLTFDSFINAGECSPPNADSQDVDQSSELLTKRARRIHWTTEERASLIEFFGSDIFTIEKLPPYKLCEKAILKYKCLRKRTKAQVKAYINNEQKRFKRMNET